MKGLYNLDREKTTYSDEVVAQIKFRNCKESYQHSNGKTVIMKQICDGNNQQQHE